MIGRLFFVTLSLVILFGASSCADEDRQLLAIRQEAAQNLTPEAIAQSAAGNNALALNLFRQLKEEEGNLFFSPYSLRQAFCMLSEAATGESLDQIRDVAGISLPLAETHPAEAGIANGLVTRSPDGEVIFDYANAIAVAELVEPPADYVSLLRTHYGARITSFDPRTRASQDAARRELNNWITKKTRGFLKGNLPPDFVNEDTAMVLVNTVYLKADWQSEFSERATKQLPFTNPESGEFEVWTMHGRKDLHYFENDDVQMLRMRYKHTTLEMDILLPRTVDGLPELEERLTQEAAEAWLSEMHGEKVDVYLPKFAIHSRHELKPVLKAMGLEAPFIGGFKSWLGEVVLGQVLQEAKIEVDEKGTEAAAYTAMQMQTIGVERETKEPKVIRADHPFQFMIRDSETGIILFMGRVVDPR